MALIIPSSQAFSLLDIEVPIKVTEEKVQVVQTCEELPFKPVREQGAIRSTQHNAIPTVAGEGARCAHPRAWSSVACVNDKRG